MRQVLPKSYLGLGISDPDIWSNEVSFGKNLNVASLVFNPFSYITCLATGINTHKLIRKQ